jgi:hypothetical protein
MSESVPESEQPQAVLEEREIQFLRSHPDQEFYFPDEAGADIGALAADILTNGLQRPIEIIPDGTVISGHRRRLAMMQLLIQGHEQFRFMEVVVRYDLAAEGPEAIKRRFLEENLNRRHLTPMAFAAVSRGLYELGIGTNQSDEQLKQQIAQQYRVITKTLERWWALLDLPIELQSLIERKQLPQGLGQQLLDYAEPQEIEELVELIRSGSPEEVERRARELLKPRIPDKSPKERPPEEIFVEFLESSVATLAEYEAIEDLVRRKLGDYGQMRRWLWQLRKAEFVVQRLLELVKTSDRLTPDDLEFLPTLGRSSIQELKTRKAASLAADGPTAQPKPKRTLVPVKLVAAKNLPPLKLTPAKKLPQLKLKKRPPAA